jgi:hypothetical protein
MSSSSSLPHSIVHARSYVGEVVEKEPPVETVVRKEHSQGVKGVVSVVSSGPCVGH